MIMTIEELYGKYLECGACVTTDSRSIKGGELFIALKGENFDGNEFALKALEAGAKYALVNADSISALSGHPGVLAVDDSFIALRQLANYHRNHCYVDGKRLTVIGLTGTNGKTTTKELIRSVLSAKYEITATEGNLNNDIGVPLSLLRIKDTTRIAVIEMGANHPDDIKHLVEVCEPDFGLITNVGKAHLLGFGSFEGVKRAKGQLFDFIAAHGGSVFLNADNPDLVAMAEARDGLSIIPYGQVFDGVSLLPSTPQQPFLRLEIGGKTVNTHLVGSYNAMNVLAALCIGRYFEVDTDAAIAAIESYVPANSRSQMSRTERNVLILDAYNANPSSMAAALDNFDAVQAEKKLALLGDMRELGADSLKEHLAVVGRIASADFKAYLVGSEFRKALDEYGQVDNILGWFESSDALASHLEKEVPEGACILVKGSRGIRMEKTVPCL